MPEQDWNNLKFNIERALPSPNEHEEVALEWQVHDLANKIREQMRENKRELYVYSVQPEIISAIRKKGFEVEKGNKNLEAHVIRW